MSFILLFGEENSINKKGRNIYFLPFLSIANNFYLCTEVVEV